MNEQHFETFTFVGDNLNRLRQALDIARYQARMAQHAAAPRLEDALIELEGMLAEQVGRIAAAEDRDEADAEESGAAERKRRSWYPRYQTA